MAEIDDKLCALASDLRVSQRQRSRGSSRRLNQSLPLEPKVITSSSRDTKPRHLSGYQSDAGISSQYQQQQQQQYQQQIQQHRRINHNNSGYQSDACLSSRNHQRKLSNSGYHSDASLSSNHHNINYNQQHQYQQQQQQQQQQMQHQQQQHQQRNQHRQYPQNPHPQHALPVIPRLQSQHSSGYQSDVCANSSKTSRAYSASTFSPTSSSSNNCGYQSDGGAIRPADYMLKNLQLRQPPQNASFSPHLNSSPSTTPPVGGTPNSKVGQDALSRLRSPYSNRPRSGTYSTGQLVANGMPVYCPPSNGTTISATSLPLQPSHPPSRSVSVRFSPSTRDNEPNTPVRETRRVRKPRPGHNRLSQGTEMNIDIPEHVMAERQYAQQQEQLQAQVLLL